MKILGKKHVEKNARVVARGCYCGALCTCYRASSIKSVYTAAQAVTWSSADVDL